MADRHRPGGVGHRQRGAFCVGDVRRRLREGSRVLVRVRSTGPAGHRRGPGELLLLAASAAVSFPPGGPCPQAGGQRVPLQSGVPGTGMEASAYQGYHARGDPLGSQGGAGSLGRHLQGMVATHGPAVLADRGPESEYEGNQVLRQQRSEENLVGGDAAGGVRSLARGDVVRARQAGGRPGIIRGANISEFITTLAMFANGHVLLGRPDRAASGGKIRGSRSNRWRRRPTAWRRKSGTATGTRMLS